MTIEHKPLHIENPADLHAAVNDVKIFGDPDTWKLVSKASSAAQGWMKSCKAQLVQGLGVNVQNETELRGERGVVTSSQSMVFIPGAYLVEIFEDGKLIGRELSGANAAHLDTEFGRSNRPMPGTIIRRDYPAEKV